MMSGPSSQPRRRARGGRHSSRSGLAAAGAETAVSGSLSSGSPVGTPQSAQELFKDAQAMTAELKELLSSQPPWSRDSEVLRQRARNTYLAILFQHPLSPHAQSLDPLWLATTYSLITAYRDIVGRIEAVMPPSRRGQSGDGNNKDAAADLRRTLSRFRTALAAEEAFYRSLISRTVKFYGLQNRTRDYLALVSVSVPEDDDNDQQQGLGSSLSREESEKKVGLVYKGLICLGDLERYKEQYSERARREAREGTAAREAKFEYAIRYYEVARELHPDNGMAFNQLAVIDGYLGDTFHCTYHYFRALAVKQPFPGGEANLERVLKKAFDRWRSSRHSEDAMDEDSTASVKDVGEFKRDLLIICSVLYLRAGTSHFAHLRESLLSSFSNLLRGRQLPSEAIVKTTAMAIGAHWCARLDTHRNSASAEASVAQKADRRRVAEDLALGFLFCLFKAMVSVSADEVEDATVVASQQRLNDSAVADDDEGDRDTILALAQHITAVIRRILPALRIMSRWLKSHLEYIYRASTGANPELRAFVESFWAQYKRLMLSLARLFPLSQLPSLDAPLEEDIDMRGFLPLRRGLSEEPAADTQQQDAHPNEEQLMRISDLLVDVKLLMQTEAGAAVLNSDTPLPSAPFIRSGTTETASLSVSTETEDDPVNLAMRATLTEGSSMGDATEEEEEVIMWGRSTTPVLTSEIGPPSEQEQLQKLSLASAPAQNTGLLFGDVGGNHGSIWTMSREESQKGARRAAATTKPLSSPWQTDGPLPSNPVPHVQPPRPQATAAPVWSQQHPQVPPVYDSAWHHHQPSPQPQWDVPAVQPTWGSSMSHHPPPGFPPPTQATRGQWHTH